MEKDIIILGNINITSLIKASNQFKKGLIKAESEQERGGVVQRFELTFELVWKILKKILAFKGININSPRETFREAAKQKFIQDPLVWFEFIKKEI